MIPGIPEQIPSEEEIRELLSVWAQAAFTTRIALRVFPILERHFGHEDSSIIKYRLLLDYSARIAGEIGYRGELSSDHGEWEDYQQAFISIFDLLNARIDKEVEQCQHEREASILYLVSNTIMIPFDAMGIAYREKLSGPSVFTPSIIHRVAQQAIACTLNEDQSKTIKNAIRNDFDTIACVSVVQEWDHDTLVGQEYFPDMWPEGFPGGWPPSLRK